MCVYYYYYTISIILSGHRRMADHRRYECVHRHRAKARPLPPNVVHTRWLQYYILLLRIVSVTKISFSSLRRIMARNDNEAYSHRVWECQTVRWPLNRVNLFIVDSTLREKKLVWKKILFFYFSVCIGARPIHYIFFLSQSSNVCLFVSMFILPSRSQLSRSILYTYSLV